MADKITYSALLKIRSRSASPVILKTRPNRLMEIVSTIAPFTKTTNPFDLSPDFQLPLKVIERFNLIATILPREVIYALADAPYVEKIFFDEDNYAFQYPTVPVNAVFTAPHKLVKSITFTSTPHTKRLLGADIANSKGYRGEGVKVAIADTGASRLHPQLPMGRVQHATVTPQERDENGHGTWIATCIGGAKATDQYLSQRGHVEVECEGIAPNCELLAIKCLGYLIGAGSTSDVINAIAVAIQMGADIINLSLGYDAPGILSAEDDPYYDVFQNVLASGIIPVVAAGNSGALPKTVGSPGSMPNCLTVGAYDPIRGSIADFSSRGPTMWGEVKPDVVGSGVSIDSGCVGVVDVEGDGVPSRFSPLSGTSMATPHVSGLLALMMQAMKSLGKTLTLAEVVSMMEALGHEKNNTDGYGIINWQMFENWIETQYGVKI